MGPDLERRGMVGQRKDPVFIELLHPVHDVPDDELIEVLDGPDLVLHITGVSCFIRRLHVEVHDVLRLEREERMLRLADVVRVEPAGGAGHVDHLESGVDAEALGEVDGGDHRALDAVLLPEGGHARPLPLAPEPDAVRGALAVLEPGLVDGVVGQEI